MSLITRIEVETWTRDEANASTDDRIDCIITFMDNRFFQQQLDNSYDNFQQGNRDRFNLDLSEPSAAAAVSGQQDGDIKSITIKKVNGSNMWKCEAVCIRVNDAALLSRYAYQDLEIAGSSFTITLRKGGLLDGLEIKITTGIFGASDTPDTDDSVYFGLKFSDGTFEIIDLHLFSMINDFEAGDVYSYLIPLSGDTSFIKYPSDVSEISLRKTGVILQQKNGHLE